MPHRLRSKLVLHIGMHKTGSTSIQHALGERRSSSHHYMRLGQANHSVPLIRLYHPNPFQHFSVVRTGMDQEAMEEHKSALQTRIFKQLKNRPEDIFVISAEWLSSAPTSALEDIRGQFAPYFKSIEVYGYVRPPASYLTSMFQQEIKTGKAEFSVSWPNYRKRLEHFDVVFGRDNVHLKPFDTKTFLDGNVVSDFSAWSRLEIPTSHDRPKRNLSLSAAAVSLLFLYRTQDGPRIGSPELQQQDDKFQTALRSLISPPFALNPQFVTDAIEENEADLDWIDDRLGTRLPRAHSEIPKGSFLFDGAESILRAAVHFCPLLNGTPAESLTHDPELNIEKALQIIETFVQNLPADSATI